MPCIMWEHYFDYGLGGCIKHLVEVRFVCMLAATVHLHFSCKWRQHQRSEYLLHADHKWLQL